jgi:cell division septum initiation protein DivIVA
MPFTGKCVLDRKELQGLLFAMRDAIQVGQNSNTRAIQQSKTDIFQTNTDTRKAIRPFEDIVEETGQVPETLPVAQQALASPEVEDARTEAARIVENAKLEAAKIREGADDYAENTLASVEQNALGAARAARKGLDVLQRRRNTGN